MEVETVGILSLAAIEPKTLLTLDVRKEALNTLVKENPFIEVTNETIGIARERRTALKKGRTSVQNDVKLICSELAGISKQVKTVGDDLIAIVVGAENLQQEPITIYEAEKEEEKRIKREAEEKRITDLQNRMLAIYEDNAPRIFEASSLVDLALLRYEILLIEIDSDEYAELTSIAEKRKEDVLELINVRMEKIKALIYQERENEMQRYYAITGKEYPKLQATADEIKADIEKSVAAIKAKAEKESLQLKEQLAEGQRQAAEMAEKIRKAEQDALDKELEVARLTDELKAKEDAMNAEAIAIAKAKTDAINAEIEKKQEIARKEAADKLAQDLLPRKERANVHVASYQESKPYFEELSSDNPVDLLVIAFHKAFEDLIDETIHKIQRV